MIIERFTRTVNSFFKKEFDNKKTPKALLDNIIHEFENNETLNLNFTKIQVIHDNEMQTLVPSALFEESNLSAIIFSFTESSLLNNFFF